jgi:hypothetical protein
VPVGEVLVHAADHFLRVFFQVGLRGGQVGVAENLLDVADREVLVAQHPHRAGVPQVMHRVVRAQRLVQSPEHRPQGLVVQRLSAQRPAGAASTAQGPPDRIARSQLADKIQVETQPDQRLGAGGQPLLGIGALAPHANQLITPVHIGEPDT